MKQIRKMSSSMGSSSSRSNSKTSGLAILIIAVLVVAYALLYVDILVLIFLFGASIIGIAVSYIIKKADLTPEDKLRESTIMQYQVPNTREALTEFTILAAQKIQPVGKFSSLFSMEGKHRLWLNKVWIAKCEGVYTRARLAMKDDPGSLAEIIRIMKKAGVNTD